MRLKGLVACGLAAAVLLTCFTGEAARHPYDERLSATRIMKPWPVETKDSGGVLLFSDSPEYVRDYGILYRDVVQGEARIFYYHVNVTARPGKLAVVLENLGQKNTQVVITRGGMAIPNTNYFEVGKGLEIAYMHRAQPEKKVFLEAGGTALLQPAMEDLLEPQKLMSGDVRFSIRRSGCAYRWYFVRQMPIRLLLCVRPRSCPRTKKPCAGHFPG